MLRFFKKGIRALGIAESFHKGKSNKALLAGVVMRADFIVDGFGFSKTTVGGLDATEAVIKLFLDIGRRDINVIMLNGCIISLFNIIDIYEVHCSTGVPVICISYRESPGIEKYLQELEDSEERLSLYKKLGRREVITLNTGKRVFVRYSGVNWREVKMVLDKFTIQGAVPEPIRVARILAKEVLEWQESESSN